MIFNLLSWASAVVVRPMAAKPAAASSMRDGFMEILLVAVAPSRERRRRVASLPQTRAASLDPGAERCLLVSAAAATSLRANLDMPRCASVAAPTRHERSPRTLCAGALA